MIQSRNQALRALLASPDYAAVLTVAEPLIVIHMETEGLIVRDSPRWRLTDAGIDRAKEVSK